MNIDQIEFKEVKLRFGPDVKDNIFSQLRSKTALRRDQNTNGASLWNIARPQEAAIYDGI